MNSDTIRKYDKVMMDTAELFAKQSYAIRRKVGAVLAKDGRVLVTGYNGTISGMSNQCEYLQAHCNQCDHTITDDNINKTFLVCPKCQTSYAPTLVTSDFVLHAEQNIITYAARKGIATEGCTLYITLSPCKQCAKLIAQSGIKKVIYKDEYKDTEGISFLHKSGVSVFKYKDIKHSM